MSPPCDEQGEMPEGKFLDDDRVELLLEGRLPHGDDVDAVVEFTRDVRSIADRPPPRPSVALASVLMAGFSPHAAAPNRRNEQKMHPPTGLLAGLVGKVVAGVSAALVGVTAAGAAGALPGPAQHAFGSIVDAVTPFTPPGGGGEASLALNLGTNPSPSADLDLSAGTAETDTGASASASAGQTSTSVGASSTAGGGSANATTAAELPSIPGLPNLPGLSSVQIPACLSDIVDLQTGQPKVPLSQISPQVISCVRTLLASFGASLPAGVNQCVNSILNLVTSVTTNPGSVPNLSGFDFSACIPVDITRCMSSMFSMFQSFMPGGSFGGFFGGGGAGATAGATTGFPSFSGMNLAGCMPFNLDQCLSSILELVGKLPGTGLGGLPGLGGGTLPSLDELDLGACVPFGSLGSVSGFGH